MGGRLLIQFFHEQGFVAGHLAQTSNKLFWEKTMSEPREIVESFIRDMNAVYKKHRPAMDKATESSQKAMADRELEEKDRKKYWTTRNRLSKKYGQLALKYKEACAEVLKKYGIPISSDYFQAVSADCIYFGDEVKEEVVVNKNTVKIYTETKERSYEHLKIYVVQMKDGQWQLAKLRRLDEQTQKDSHLDW